MRLYVVMSVFGDERARAMARPPLNPDQVTSGANPLLMAFSLVPAKQVNTEQVRATTTMAMLMSSCDKVMSLILIWINRRPIIMKRMRFINSSMTSQKIKLVSFGGRCLCE